MDGAFPSPIFKELTNTKQKYVQISYTELDTIKSANESSFTASSEVQFNCVCFHESHNHSIIFGGYLYRMLFPSIATCRKVGQHSVYNLK